MAKKRNLTAAAIVDLLDRSESDEEHGGKHCKAATTLYCKLFERLTGDSGQSAMSGEPLIFEPE